MAQYTAEIATHETSGTAVDEVQLQVDYPAVEVLCRAAGSPIYFCVDGIGGPSGDGIPAIEGEDCYVVLGVAGASLRVPSRLAQNTLVKLITAGATAYSITGLRD